MTLVLISKDEAASCIKVTAAQAFETQKDSSGEESDSGDTMLDYKDKERASVLPNEEDEEADHTADGGIMVGDDTQTTQTLNPGEVDDEELANTQETADDGIDDKRPAVP